IAPGGVQEKEGVIPDLTAMGKIIGGGLPVGAFGGRADIMACLAPEGPVYQAGTLSGNPLAMVAGITALELLEDLTIYSKLDLAGKRIEQALSDAALGKGLPLQVPQRGSMFALFFSEEPVTNFEQGVASSADHFKVLFRYALDNGVYLAPSAFETCFISTAHDEKAITRTIEVLTEGIRKI
ncbi:MAG: aminotransferase class III-fold pyridoxal phosphate-dependent enzyme, partial [Opitutae bacterium]